MSGLRFPIEPRMIPVTKVARRLGVPVKVFEEKREALESRGFPKPDPDLGTYCLQAVDDWIDARNGLNRPGQPMSPQAAMKDAVRGRAWGT